MIFVDAPNLVPADGQRPNKNPIHQQSSLKRQGSGLEIRRLGEGVIEHPHCHFPMMLIQPAFRQFAQVGGRVSDCFDYLTVIKRKSKRQWRGDGQSGQRILPQLNNARDGA
jgi:hypothetical protein